MVSVSGEFIKRGNKAEFIRVYYHDDEKRLFALTFLCFRGGGEANIQVTLVSTMYNHFKFGWHYIHECDVLIEREKALSFNFIKKWSYAAVGGRGEAS
jgi:hypothetical protein